MPITNARRIRGSAEEYNSKQLGPADTLADITIEVETPNVDYAGTDADVYFVINDRKFLLDKPSYDDFEKGDVDAYTFPLQMTMRDIRKAVLQIGHNNKRRNAGWYCGQIRAYVRPANQHWNRLYRTWPEVGWLADDENQGELWATLQDGQEL